MTSKSTLLTFAFATLVALPSWGAPSSANRGTCSDVPLLLIVAPQTPGQGGISGVGVSIYNNPNDPAFNGGTQLSGWHRRRVHQVSGLQCNQRPHRQPSQH